MKKLTLLAPLFLAASCLNAQDTTTWSLQCAYNPDYWSRSLGWEAGPSMSNTFELGGRVHTAGKVSIDLMLGAVYFSGYDADESTATIARPPIYSALGKIGALYDLHKGDRSTLAALIHFGCNYDKTITTNLNDNTLTAYKVLSPFAFVGIEPSYDLTRFISLFSRIGTTLRYNPATKAYESYVDNSTEPSRIRYELTKKANSSATLSLEGLCIGIRYRFSTTYFE